MNNLRVKAYWAMPMLIGGLFIQQSMLQSTSAQSQRPMTEQDVLELIDEVSNWGRWGKDDQLGAINLITAEKRRQAAQLVKVGESVSLARQAETTQAPDNPNPFGHQMLTFGRGTKGQWSVDEFRVSYHGYAHTHMDSLCHLFFRGKMYNGFSRDEITKEGAQKLSIHNLKNGIFSRGILVDIPRLRGLDYLEPSTPIYPEELEAWENRAGITVQPGDVVFIRTGRWARRDALGAWDVAKEGSAGLHASCARWLKKRDVAMIGSDAASDVLPSGIPGVSHPVHLLVLHAMGIHIFDNCDLEALGETAERFQRWDFLIQAAPIPVKGGTGSPLNPIATF
ncbi:MAG: cyclase family protein [Pirellulaceae bacterium]|nr:cyclase family protein [Pirellulaceae bacterium]